MASMDIFSQNAFSMVSLTEAIQDLEVPPQAVGAMNLFAPARCAPPPSLLSAWPRNSA